MRVPMVPQKELKDLFYELLEFSNNFEEQMQTQAQSENQESRKRKRCNETSNTSVVNDTNVVSMNTFLKVL